MCNRAARRAAAAYKGKRTAGELGLGTIILTATIKDPSTGLFYWLECSTDFIRGADPSDSALMYGPFKTEAECKENRLIVLLGRADRRGVSAWSRTQ